MVWVTITDRGISKPYFCPWKMSLSMVTYCQECIKKHLVPFLDLYHADGTYYFWPDLATSHYAKATLKVYREEHIAFIPKAAPKLRPVENFWGWLKSRVYDGGWEAIPERALKQRISLKLQEFTIKDPCALSKRTCKRLQILVSREWFNDLFVLLKYRALRKMIVEWVLVIIKWINAKKVPTLICLNLLITYWHSSNCCGIYCCTWHSSWGSCTWQSCNSLCSCICRAPDLNHLILILQLFREVVLHHLLERQPQRKRILICCCCFSVILSSYCLTPAQTQSILILTGQSVSQYTYWPLSHIGGKICILPFPLYTWPYFSLFPNSSWVDGQILIPVGEESTFSLSSDMEKLKFKLNAH